MAGKTVTQPADATGEAWALVPDSCRELADPQRDLPRIARDQALMAQIESAVRSVPTRHDLHLGDARRMDFLTPESVRLVVTSPPYWTLKEYRRGATSGSSASVCCVVGRHWQASCQWHPARER